MTRETRLPWSRDAVPDGLEAELRAVVEAAGGIVTDWAGGPAHGGGRVLAAANNEIHAAALAVLAGAA